MRHLLLLAILLVTPQPVQRFKCIVTIHDEILCFDGVRMFRPERRFDSFTIEVP